VLFPHEGAHCTELRASLRAAISDSVGWVSREEVAGPVTYKAVLIVPHILFRTDRTPFIRARCGAMWLRLDEPNPVFSFY
jgi:hypothetical protein